MPSAPPSFGSQEYWNKRFTSNPNAFEWLEEPTTLDPYISTALKEADDSTPQLLHIGCGTSSLSYHLRTHVQSADQIHNLDYSQVAIDVGRKREADNYQPEQAAEPPRMRWSAVDLLNHISLLAACQPSSYSVVLDKSTSDSIACSEDLHIPLPYYITTTTLPPLTSSPAQSPEPIHPLHMMAIHLALVTKPKARWISVSYSMDRYPFLNEPSLDSTSSKDTGSEEGGSLNNDLDHIPPNVIENGFPDPNALWKLIAKDGIEPLQVQPSNGHSGPGTTHRPKVLHWIYVLERTNVPLYVRKQ